MLKLALVLAAALLATPAFADTPPDRDTAVSTLAKLYNSADVCALFISRSKVEAYASSARTAADTLFNVDVFKATRALYEEQKSWTKEQTDSFCKTAADTARQLGVTLN